MFRLVSVLCFVVCPLCLAAQCDITEKLMADGTMYYHGETLLFYKTSQFQLSGNIVTDKEHYYLRLRPLPYPEKPLGTKLNSDLEVKLANDSTYKLKLHDAYYRKEDTSFTILFIFEKKDIHSFTEKDVAEVKLNLGESTATYTFLMHKDAIRQQLNCFTKKENKY
jgi:hypothetical protein